MIKGCGTDEVRAVNFLGTEIARAFAKSMLEKACIVQTKVLLSSEVNFLTFNEAPHKEGKLILQVKKEAVVLISVKGKRNDKDRAITFVGSQEAIKKA